MVSGAHRSGGASRVSAVLQRAAVLVGFSVSLSDPTRAMSCVAAVQTAPGLAVAVCQREYERDRMPSTGFLLADSLRSSGNLDAADAIARGLLTTPERANAFQILGKIATEQERYADAERSLETARDLHRQANRRGAVARDSQALARVFTESERFTDALVAVDECIVESKAIGDAETEMYCRMTAARVLLRVGYFALAQQELDRAAPSAKTDREQASLAFERGNLHQEVSRAPLGVSHQGQAVVAFERALALASRSGLTGLVQLVEMNLAYSLGELLRFDEAEQHLETAKRLDVDNQYADIRQMLAARFAFLRGNLTLADQLNTQVYDVIASSDERIEIATLQARIALRTGDMRSAETWAMRGVSEVERIRAKQSIELRPWVLSTRREPYEVQFVVLARTGRFEQALLVFDQWQGRSLFDRMAYPATAPAAGLRDTAKQVRRMGDWLPVVSTAPIMRRASGRAALDVLAKLDLYALAVAEDSVFAISARAGKIDIRELGRYEGLQPRVDRFIANPTDVDVAMTLGKLLLPPEVSATTNKTLHVLLDGPIAALPFSALRRADREPLVAARPVIRVLRLPETACVSAMPTRMTVLADADSDLPAARREGEEVAALLPHARLEVGSAAKREVLFGTERGSLLHIAVHAKLSIGGGTLLLHDGPVSALEISASKLAPSLVMLSACGSATATDSELAGALTTAFIASGSNHVIATLRPVSDVGSRELATAFYRAGGSTDSVRALARVQARLAKTSNTDWPSFAVFGNDVCN